MRIDTTYDIGLIMIIISIVKHILNVASSGYETGMEHPNIRHHLVSVCIAKEHHHLLAG